MQDQYKIEIKNDAVTILLRQVASMLAMIPLDELEAHHKECADSVNRFSELAPILNPIAWFAMNQNGELDNAEYQNKIVEHLLAARREIEKREIGLAKYREG